MATIKIQKEAIPIIKSGLAIEENLLMTMQNGSIFSSLTEPMNMWERS